MNCNRCKKKIEKGKEAIKDCKYYCQRCFYLEKHPPTNQCEWIVQAANVVRENK